MKEYNENVKTIAERLHEAYGTKGEGPSTVEYEVATKLDEMGVEDFALTGSIGDPKISFEKDGEKLNASYPNWSNEEYVLNSKLMANEETGEIEDLVKIEEQKQKSM